MKLWKLYLFYDTLKNYVLRWHIQHHIEGQQLRRTLREWNVLVYVHTFNSVQSQNQQSAMEVSIPWFSRKRTHLSLVHISGMDTFDRSIPWITVQVILLIYLFIPDNTTNLSLGIHLCMKGGCDFLSHGTDKQSLIIIPIQYKMLSNFTVISSWFLFFIY